MGTMARLEDWTSLARCRGMADALFPEGKDQKRARVVCMGCPVRAVCLAEALDNRIEWGVWGGLTERERRQLLRQRPDVQSWRAVLTATADDDHQSLPAEVTEVIAGTRGAGHTDLVTMPPRAVPAVGAPQHPWGGSAGRR